MNIQRAPLAVELQDIVTMTPVWTRAFGVLPIRPNSIRLTLENGDQHRIVCREGHVWVTEIEQRISALANA